MAHLILKRGGGWRDRLRRYDILVDGKRMGRLRADSATHLEISEGPHRLHLAIDGWGSEPRLLFVSEGCPTLVSCEPGPAPAIEVARGVACRTDYIVTQLDNAADVAREYLRAAWRIAAYRISQRLRPGPLGQLGLSTGDVGVLYRGCRDARSTVSTTDGSMNHALWLQLAGIGWLEPAAPPTTLATTMRAFRVTDLGRIELLDILV